MGSATRAALATANSVLAGQKVTDLAVGDGLLQAGRVIGSSAGLRSILADTATPLAEKKRLLTSLLGSLPAASKALLETVVAERWSEPDDLLDAIEELGIRAISMAEPEADLQGQLYGFAQIVAGDHELELAVGSALSQSDAKRALVERLLSGKAHPGTLAIISHLVQQPRGRRIGTLLSFAAQTVADQRGSVVAIVTSAKPLTPAQQKDLAGRLGAEAGREVSLEVHVDPSLIGGLRIQLGDHVVDGSVSARLNELRLQLAG